MASLPSNKNSGLWAGKVTSSWRRGPSSLHGSLGSIWKPCWSAPSFFSSHHRSNAKWHESGGGVSKNAWLHLNAYATHEIGASLVMLICPNCTHNRTQSVQGVSCHKEETCKSVVIQGVTCFTGQPAVQQRFHTVPPPPTTTTTHTDTHTQVENRCRSVDWRLSVPASVAPQAQSGSQASVWI